MYISIFLFQLFDRGGKGYILEKELTEILHEAFNMNQVDIEYLFEQVDTDNDGKIHFGLYYFCQHLFNISS